jgi:RNA polymerase sigma-70 factor (ECF subfamily)
MEHEVAGVYAASSRRLIGLLTVMGGSAADAEEITQDAFVKLLEKWPRVREYDDVEGWLRTVAVRMLISRYRRRRVASGGLLKLSAGARTTVSPDSADSRVDLAAALATLPVTYRAAVLLHHVHDLPVDEVATILRVPVGTVKSRLSRARAALAPLVAEDIEPERSTP